MFVAGVIRPAHVHRWNDAAWADQASCSPTPGPTSSGHAEINAAVVAGAHADGVDTVVDPPAARVRAPRLAEHHVAVGPARGRRCRDDALLHVLLVLEAAQLAESVLLRLTGDISRLVAAIPATAKRLEGDAVGQWL